MLKITNKKSFYVSLCFIAAFAVFTFLVKYTDVRSIGPDGSFVGFAALNGFVRELVGTNMTLYEITDWLGLVPVAFVIFFAVLGFIQWIKRKSFFKVDADILIFGVYCVLVISVYVLFEYLVINYRPVLISGFLEASYPSSTTMLVLSVMPACIVLLVSRIKNKISGNITASLISVFIAFMLLGRFFSGVHWITDIIGGVIISTGLFLIYCSLYGFNKK